MISNEVVGPASIVQVPPPFETSKEIECCPAAKLVLVKQVTVTKTPVNCDVSPPQIPVIGPLSVEYSSRYAPGQH